MKVDARVVIVGRMNVGKSSLFNRLSTSVKSMTFDFEGVTRDFITDTVCWQDHCFDLVDTGGVSLKKSVDAIGEIVRQQALKLIDLADIILFVVDSSAGITAEDREIGKLLHKQEKNVIVVANKSDVKGAADRFFEFDRLGFKLITPVSCAHGTGVSDLLDHIGDQMAVAKPVIEEKRPEYKVVLLGKPNVGKSSLLNALIQQERAIVAEIPGTTREAITERVTFYQEDILVTDTPGIRRQRSVKEPLEGLMVKSALRAVKDADIVLLLIDASQGGLSDQELKLAFYVFTSLHKSLIILFNKEDLVTEEIKKQRTFETEVYEYFLKKIEIMDISCKTGKNVGRIIPLVNKVWARCNQEFTAHDLTLLFQEALHRKPLYHKSELIKVFRVRQVKKAPISLLMIVNRTAWFKETQLGYFDNVLRYNYDLKSAPLILMPRTS